MLLDTYCSLVVVRPNTLEEINGKIVGLVDINYTDREQKRQREHHISGFFSSNLWFLSELFSDSSPQFR